MMLSTTEKVAKNTRFYFCDQCDYKTSKQANLKRHKNKHNKPPKPIRSKHCEKCNFTFTTYYKFKVHYVKCKVILKGKIDAEYYFELIPVKISLDLFFMNMLYIVVRG